jgi:hypothetical protein
MSGSRSRPWSRPLLALAASLVLHALAVAVLAGRAAWQGWALTRSVDLELVSAVTEVKQLPLGPPPPAGHQAARRRARARAQPVGLAVALGDAGVSEADAGASHADAGAGADGGAPRSRDLRGYGPEGSKLIVLLRLDRLRAGPQAAATIAAVDELLRLLPDRQRLVEGTGLDLFRDFEALLVATPNPLDADVTFLAARHHLSDQQIMAAFERGARLLGRPISWRPGSDRPVGVRKGPLVPGRGPTGLERDDRLLLLPQPGLAVMAPPAYAPLLLAEGHGDAGARSWTELVARIDAEGEAMPEDAVLMMTAAGLFQARAPSGPGQPDLAPPALATAVVGTTPAPFLELTAEFAEVEAAAAWERQWPGLKERLTASPLVLISGLLPVIAHAELRRDEAVVSLRTTASHAELLRVLGMITGLLGRR